MKKYDVVIVGAGASGLMTAVQLKDKNIAIVEGNSKLGKKLLATGNGRCNILNENLSIDHFYGDVNEFSKILNCYSVENILNEFEKIGVSCFKDDEGRYYPKSQQSAQVLKAMWDTLTENNVDIITDFKVVDIKKKDDFEIVSSENEKIYAKTLVLSVGGKASPKHSAMPDGCDLAKKLGHSVTKITPSLTKFDCNDKNLKSLSGVKAKCKATLISNGKSIYSEVGEMIFSDKTLSGICLFNLSNHANKCFEKGEKVKIGFDFLPNEKEIDIKKIISNRPNMKCMDILNAFVNMKLGFYIVKKSGIDVNMPVKNLTDQQINKLIQTLKHCVFDVTRHENFDNAQVTSGGVPLKEIDVKTMQSKICKSLYFTGEMINVHGDCGGFNLYIAWSTGMIVGGSID